HYGRVSLDLVRLCLLLGFIILYMCLGAAVFSVLEREAEMEAHGRWDGRLAQFAEETRVDVCEIRSFLREYEEASFAGVQMEPRRARWDFSGAFYFVATIISTIGFGMTAPSTFAGKVFLLFYGLFGCSATILFFNMFLERVISLMTLMMQWSHRNRQQKKWQGTGVEERGRNEEDGEVEWRPSLYSVALILGATSLVVTCGAASFYSVMEDWGYLESLYFCFVTFSTMGFGDLVSGQKESYAAGWAYHLANSLLLILGVCCTYSVFNVNSVAIKHMVNWILDVAGRLRCPSSLPAEVERTDGLDCCCPPRARGDGEATTRHTPTRWSLNMATFARPSASKDRCQCSSSAVEAGIGAIAMLHNCLQETSIKQ
uniref:Potassium channel domain-containing protein n=1 Tax=Denticeps clupeoides TaxID=299321 RepID=A0AAY4CWY3_9TELE